MRTAHFFERFFTTHRSPAVLLAILAMCAVLVPATESFADSVVTYDGGSPNRPVLITNLLVNGVLYDVSITYNNNGATNPLRVGEIPDADLDLAIGATRFVLNMQGIVSYRTDIFFQPNVDTLVTEPLTQMQTSGSTFTPFPGSTIWSFGTVDTAFPAADFATPQYGFAQFTVVEPEVIVPSSLSVTRGNLAAGTVDDLADSDNLDVSIRRSSTDIQSRTEFEVSANSPTSTPTTMDLTLEASVFARLEVTQTIELFDFDSDSWEQVDSRPASRFIDAVVEVSVAGDVSRFVESGSSNIQARIRFVSANPRQQFTSHTDQFIWTIGQ